MIIGTWILWAFLSFICMGLINVLDSFFVESEDVYQDAYEGMIVSSIFKLVGVLSMGVFFYSVITSVSSKSALIAAVGGFVMSLAYMFYFFTLFYHNDTSLVQLYWNISIPIVMVLSWFFLGERLSGNIYIGILIVFLGALIVSFSKKAFKCDIYKFSLLMMPMVFLYSISEVIMKYVEDISFLDYRASFFFFCLGQVLFGIILLILRKNEIKRSKLISRTLKQNKFFFILSETLELCGIFFMQLAIISTPSVTVYSSIEAFMPIFVILITGVSVFILKFFNKGRVVEKIFWDNLSDNFVLKLVATLIMVVGIYFIS